MAQRPTRDPDLLELRIHGVRNTPPHRMLGTTPDNVVSCRGDALAGFSTRRGSDPRGHHIEAYGWGLLARFTGIPRLGRVGDAVVRLLWFAVAPFGLANSAYWSRHRIGPGPGGPDPDPARRVADTISRGPGAGTVRLFGLLLTLLFVTTAAAVAFDMAGAHCFPAAGRGPVECGAATAVLEPLAGWTPGQRTALLAAAPLAALATVGALPLLGRTRYLPGPDQARSGPAPQPAPVPGEGAFAARAAGEAAARPGAPAASAPPDAAGRRPGGGGWTGPGASEAPGGRPLLAERDLWVVGSGMGRLRRVHVGAALAWLAAIVAEGRVLGMVRDGWSAHWPGAWGWPVLAAAALALAAVGAGWILRPQAEAPGTGRPAFHALYWLAAAVVLGAALALSAADGATPVHREPAGPAATTVVLLLGLALAATLLRSLASSRGRDRRALGWAGTGPFVFAGLAAGFGLMLSCAVVVGSGRLLGGIDPPEVFTLQAGGMAAAGLGALAWFGWCQWRVWRAGRGLVDEELADARRHLESIAGEWTLPSGMDEAVRLLWKARRLAALLRRAELYAGALAWTVFAGGWFGAALAVLRLAGVPESRGTSWAALHALGVTGLWAAAAALLVLAVSSSREEARPFGLLWDLTCFLPTQAHPFGPPCYSERAVPEFADRVADWLDGRGDACARPAPDPSRRRVVLASHSIGGVLTIFTLFHLAARGFDGRWGRIAVVSYGTQLRHFFGRFFPQVLGPDVVGQAPAGAPSATGRHPWPPTAAGEEALAARGWPAPRRPGALSRLLGDRWLNLYRRTDPLGYPLLYTGTADDDGGAGPGGPLPGAGTPTDRPAEEFERGAYQFRIAGHGDYLPTAAYARALQDAALMVAPPPHD